jgi:hypothetical protein
MRKSVVSGHWSSAPQTNQAIDLRIRGLQAPDFFAAATFPRLKTWQRSPYAIQCYFKPLISLEIL